VPYHLIDESGTAAFELGRQSLGELAARPDFYWLDLHAPSEKDVELLGEVFGFHPLAVEDATHFGQRPKVDPYDDYTYIVVFGAAPDSDNLVEVHCFYSARFLVTVRRDPSPAFNEARQRHERRRQAMVDPSYVLYRVVDALVDSFFPLLFEFDEFIDAVEEGIAQRPTDEQLHRIFLMKRRLVALRKVIAPQRDLVATIANGIAELPGMTEEGMRSFRDVYDHLIRLTDVLDSYRDLLTGVTDVYLSSVSNRLNAVMKQLTLIATIFLPLAFITGFFGQNFPWMVEHIGGLGWFIVLGIGAPVATVTVLLVYFRRRGWF
jgi:magnesium transporter